MKTLIIIPAYNEEKKIGGVIDQCLRYSPHVLAVNDGSSDATLDAIRKTRAVCLDNEGNRGKGFCLKRGFDYAVKNGFDFIITLDADGQHDPACIPLFVEAAQKGFDVIIGTRKKSGSTMPYVRRASNFLLSEVFSLLIGWPVMDTQSGYRGIRVEVLEGLELVSDRYETETELLMKLGRKKVRFGSVRIPVIYGDEKSSISPVKDFFRFLRVLKYRK
ncbi:MAG: glycosyltransferase family 2 protein [Pseudomonadota bacterium]